MLPCSFNKDIKIWIISTCFYCSACRWAPSLPLRSARRSNPVSFWFSSPGSWWPRFVWPRRPWPWSRSSSLLDRTYTAGDQFPHPDRPLSCLQEGRKKGTGDRTEREKREEESSYIINSSMYYYWNTNTWIFIQAFASGGHGGRKTRLTAAQWPHLSILRVDLGDVGHAFAQHVHGDLIAILIHPVRCFIPRPLHLRPAISWRDQKWQEKHFRFIYQYKNEENTVTSLQSVSDDRIWLNLDLWEKGSCKFNSQHIALYYFSNSGHFFYIFQKLYLFFFFLTVL